MTTEEATQLAVIANDIKWIKDIVEKTDEKLDAVCGHVEDQDTEIYNLKSKEKVDFKLIVLVGSSSLALVGSLLGLFFSHVFA